MNAMPARVLAAAVLLCACRPGAAGIFNKNQTPPDWGLEAAKTHVPDYAKDATAVVLFEEYVETVDGAGRAVERKRSVVRILKPQGRSEGICGVAYDVDEKVNYFRVWTIAADEKQYQAQESDFIEAGDTNVPVMLSTQKARVVNPPAVDVGATVICESEELMAPYFQEKMWGVQRDVPVVLQALEVDLPAGRSHAQSWHNSKAVPPVEVAPNHWRWEVKDTPALILRDIPSRPDWEALAARMNVQWGDAAVDGTDNEWRAIGKWYTTLEADRPAPSPEITAQTQSLISGAPDFYAKLSRITDYIQKNIRYFIVMRGVGGWQPNHAGDIFRNKYGDCKDKTTLLISMLQVAGIHAYYLAVDTRRGFVDPQNPSLFGDHMITAIEVPADVQDPRLMAIVKGQDGKRYLIFDPTNERVPVGNLPSYLQGSYGALAAGAASQVIALPVLPPEANPNERKGSFTLAADGTLSGSVDSIHSGSEGGELRNDLKRADEKERREALETAVAHDVPGVVLNSFEYVQPTELDKPIEVHYKLTAGQYAHQAGTLLLVRPRVVGSHVLPFDDKPRTVAIDLSATGRWRDSFDIALPAGYVVDETPDPVNLDVDFASYHSTVTSKDNKLHYEREYVVRQVEIPADKAAEFRRLEGAILSDEKGTAVLKKQ
jgi:transglutaminase-like putative cysteine protease